MPATCCSCRLLDVDGCSFRLLLLVVIVVLCVAVVVMIAVVVGFGLGFVATAHLS